METTSGCVTGMRSSLGVKSYRLGPCLALAILVLSPQGLRAQDDAVSLDEIRASWRESAAAYDTASFKWIRESVKLSYRGTQLTTPVPLVSSYRIILAGDSTYQESDIESYSQQTRAANPLNGRIEVFHNLETRTYMPVRSKNSA